MVAIGERIYLGHPNDAYITVVDKNGVIQDVIGQPGLGPGELGRGVLAMTAWKNDLYVVSSSRPRQLTWFRDGVFKNQIHLPSINIKFASSNANTFAAANGTVMFPAHPSTKRLANAITADKQIPVGKLLFDKRHIDLIRRIPAVNDTNWQYENGFWYAVFKFHPMIQKYDSEFNLVETFNIKNGFTNNRHEELLDYDPERFSSAPPLFYDFKVKDGAMYLSLTGGILKLSPSGETEKLFTFYGSGESFASLGNAGVTLNLPFFVVLDDGELLLSSFGESWGHPIWLAKTSKPNKR